MEVVKEEEEKEEEDVVEKDFDEVFKMESISLPIASLVAWSSMGLIVLDTDRPTCSIKALLCSAMSSLLVR